ncbi:MAG: proton-conducting transporter membrane subunit [Eubacteriales bacterium]|nr:proton-conducting transporter membrane subunit [Eubacteriales bacterium]
MILLLPVLLPVLGGALLALLPLEDRKTRSIYVEAFTLATSLVLFWLIFSGQEHACRVMQMTEKMSLGLRMDGLSRVFCALIAFLWPLATLYGFNYMEHEHAEKRFFVFYLISYGVTAGIATASNLFTLYVCYELLTLVTLPLVLHKMDIASVRAGRKYLYYSIGGAALAFIGLIFVMIYGESSTEFVFGGSLEVALAGSRTEMLRVVYVLSFVGFGAKAAVFPMQAWLPQVGVAPTPVTALLHAVAVVKAGAFAVIRMTYYSFGTELIAGTWAQGVIIALAALTIVYGSAMALKEQHMKRRLAWSTVSNLSYILLGAALLTEAGLTGALTHMLVHGVVKITLFFCVGAVMVRTGQEYVQGVRGFGRLMPVTAFAFLLASAALVGVPPLPGFISKWNLATAASQAGPMGLVGLAALVVSAVLTACYLFPVAVNMYFRPLNANLHVAEGANRDPDWRMKLPFVLLCVTIVVLGFCAYPLTNWLSGIAGGLY